METVLKLCATASNAGIPANQIAEDTSVGQQQERNGTERTDQEPCHRNDEEPVARLKRALHSRSQKHAGSAKTHADAHGPQVEGLVPVVADERDHGGRYQRRADDGQQKAEYLEQGLKHGRGLAVRGASGDVRGFCFRDRHHTCKNIAVSLRFLYVFSEGRTGGLVSSPGNNRISMDHNSAKSSRHARTSSAAARLWLQVQPFLFASIVVGLAAATAPVLQRLPHANLSLLFMAGVLIVAVRHGVWPSIYASLLSFLVFNFFFTDPRYTFKVGAEGDVATLVFFLLMASLTGNLAARMRDAMAKRERATARISALQGLTRRVAGAATGEQVLQILADQLAGDFSCGVVAVAAHPKTGVILNMVS